MVARFTRKICTFTKPSSGRKTQGANDYDMSNCGWNAFKWQFLLYYYEDLYTKRSLMHGTPCRNRLLVL